MIYSNIDSFYISAEQLEASPSRTDGIDADTERTLRHLCCDLVAEATILLRLPQVVAATAQVLVQRFYCKRSLKRFDVKVRPACWPKGGGGWRRRRARWVAAGRRRYAALQCAVPGGCARALTCCRYCCHRPAVQEVALAAFWLACKLEEVIEIDNPQRLTLRSCVMVVDRVARRREGRSLAIMDPYSQVGGVRVRVWRGVCRCVVWVCGLGVWCGGVGFVGGTAKWRRGFKQDPSAADLCASPGPCTAEVRGLEDAGRGGGAPHAARLWICGARRAPASLRAQLLPDAAARVGAVVWFGGEGCVVGALGACGAWGCQHVRTCYRCDVASRPGRLQTAGRTHTWACPRPGHAASCRRGLQQEAWNIANDSLRTPLCVRYKAQVVACGILFTAARKLKVRGSNQKITAQPAPARALPCSAVDLINLSYVSHRPCAGAHAREPALVAAVRGDRG